MGLIAATMLLLLVSFFVVEPTVKQILAPAVQQFAGAQTDWSILVQQRLLEALTCAWFFMLGASLGSFLHCVEYRWPRGISVVARGSACPGCETSIHLWHNVPVFGWLWLRGRCARCGWEIPPRYALTELAFGIVFVLLMWAELIGGGINLPLATGRRSLGVVDNIWDPDWQLIGFFAYHALLLTFLLTLNLFAWDRFRVPTLLAGGAIALGCLWPLAGTMIHPVGWDGISNTIMATPRMRIAWGLAAGSLAGLILGNCLVRRTPGNIRAGDPASTILGMLLVGLYLGWQAALAVTALAIVARAILAFTAARRWPVVASIVLATLCLLISWRWLAQLPVYPGLHGHLWATIGLVCALPIAAMLVDGIEQGGDAGPAIIEKKPVSISVSETPSAFPGEDPVVVPDDATSLNEG